MDILPPSTADPLNKISSEIKIAAMASPKNKKLGKAISKNTKISAIIAQAHQAKYIVFCITLPNHPVQSLPQPTSKPLGIV